MKTLSIETSTGQGSVALLEDDKVQFYISSPEQKSHSEVVHSFIEEGLKNLQWKVADIDLFATTIGPGSFTGIRVSINSTKSFAFVFNKPILGVDSLMNLARLNAHLVQESSGMRLITCMINAYKNMVYFGQYAVHKGVVSVKTEPTVVRVQDLGTVINEPTLVVGDGFLTYEPHIGESVKPHCRRLTSAVDYPNASMTGTIAREIWLQKKATSSFEWNLISPLYLRASEAEENKKGIKYTPL